MRPGLRPTLSAPLRLLGLASLALIAAPLAPAPAAAQTNREPGAPALSANLIQTNRAVGVRGNLKNTYWVETSDKALDDILGESGRARMASAPAIKTRRTVWMARADIASAPGDEILVQIRSPLTCGTLGCQMMVVSEAGGEKRVLMETVGDTIDAPSTDDVTINAGSKSQRSWRYEGASFRSMR